MYLSFIISFSDGITKYIVNIMFPVYTIARFLSF